MTLTNFFFANPILMVVISLVFGLLVGSFLNVVIYRLPQMMQAEWTKQCYELFEIKNSSKPSEISPSFNLAMPNSHCPKCKHEISTLQNIPLFSWFFLRGKCSYCQASISARYPIMEAFTGLITALVVFKFGFTWLTLAMLFLSWSLIVLTMIDFDHQLLPDDITLPLLWLGLVINSLGLITSLEQAVWGAIVGYAILWGVYWLFKLVTGKEGMGYGDFKLLAALGAWMGWQSLPLIILLSSFVGAVIGLSLIVIKGRDKNIPIPFGPYLASAGFLALLWGDELIAFYYCLIT